jgi:hypothetical protein
LLDGDVALSISLTAITSLIKHYISAIYRHKFSWNFFGVAEITSDISMTGIALKDGIGCNGTSYYWDDYQRLGRKFCHKKF